MNYRNYARPTNLTCAEPSESTNIDIGKGQSVTKEFLMGVVVGASFGIFLAPDSGENTRRKLRQRGERLFRSGSEAGLQSNRSERDSEYQSGKAATGTRSGVERGTDQSVTEVLNHARKDELMSVEGIDDMTAKRIIRNRPYESAEEAVQEEVIPETTLENVKEQLVEGNSSTENAA
jgi:gas vesicle protein